MHSGPWDFPKGCDPSAAARGFFVVRTQPSGRVSIWACMGRTQETPGWVHPPANPTSLSARDLGRHSESGGTSAVLDESLPHGYSG